MIIDHMVTQPPSPGHENRWIAPSIILGCALFVIALAVSAYFEPQWRLLHVLQALIYVAVVVLTRRQLSAGYGAGVFSATFWNALVLLRTPVGAAIPGVLGGLLHGTVADPGILVQLVGVLGHFLIIAGCLAAFLPKQPKARDWSRFVAGGVIAIGYLLVAAFTLGPPEAAAHLRQALGL